MEKTHCESPTCNQARDMYEDDRISTADWSAALCWTHEAMVRVIAVSTHVDDDERHQEHADRDEECATCDALNTLDKDLGRSWAASRGSQGGHALLEQGAVPGDDFDVEALGETDCDGVPNPGSLRYRTRRAR